MKAEQKGFNIGEVDVSQILALHTTHFKMNK